MTSGVRVRFCPSPTGNPHVGLVRTALFNWAFARHVGGTFVFRIEDTDAARDSEDSYASLLDTMRWLGLTWDEGPEVGGPYAPYRQSQRMDIYADVAAKLLAAGHAYESFSTPDEIEARRKARGQDPKLGYDGADRELTDAQRLDLRAQGRLPVLRMRMPSREVVFDDVVRGEVRFAEGSIPDYVIVRQDGSPLYTLTNPVDDAMMAITHVLRGEDLLSSTPRQVVMYDALADIGVLQGEPPRFGHLPYVMGQGNKKLSKRDPEASIGYYRDAGFVPEGLLNYLALLGWSIAEDRDIFTMQEMAEAFEIERVNANPARFDLKKCEAINGEWIRRLTPDDFAARTLEVLALDGLVSAPPTAQQSSLVAAAAPLVQERVTLMRQVSSMLNFLFVDEIVVEADAVKSLDATVVAAAIEALTPLEDWSTDSISTTLRTTLIVGLGLKPRNAFGAVRSAVTGRRVSPPLFESMELLGRERSLQRLHSALVDDR